MCDVPREALMRGNRGDGGNALFSISSKCALVQDHWQREVTSIPSAHERLPEWTGSGLASHDELH